MTNKTSAVVSDLYRITSDGTVYGKRGKPLGQSIQGGYAYVSLSIGDRTRKIAVHRLVAHVFLGLDLDDSDLQVNHKDGDKLNNNLSNLEIVTRSQNMRHVTRVLNKGHKPLCDHLDEQALVWMSFLSKYWTNERIALAFETTSDVVASAIRKQRRVEQEAKAMWSPTVFQYGEG
jgi:hypothetical protein